MNTALSVTHPGSYTAASSRLLDASARFWVAAALVGQWIFAYYTGSAYVQHVLRGDLPAMSKAMSNAYATGDVFGNLAVALHMTFAFAVMLGGPLQLLPAIRARFPTLHRWNGRAYLAGVVIASLAGLIMIWGRGTYSLGVKLGGTGNALLVFAFAALALRSALARDFVAHRRWALRLFIAGSAVWFFRVILMAWVAAFGPVGIHLETASGPFLEIMAFGQYLLPLALLEGYLHAKQSQAPRVRWAMGVALLLSTLIMGSGITIASKAEWLGV